MSELSEVINIEVGTLRIIQYAKPDAVTHAVMPALGR